LNIIPHGKEEDDPAPNRAPRKGRKVVIKEEGERGKRLTSAFRRGSKKSPATAPGKRQKGTLFLIFSGRGGKKKEKNFFYVPREKKGKWRRSTCRGGEGRASCPWGSRNNNNV